MDRHPARFRFAAVLVAVCSAGVPARAQSADRSFHPSFQPPGGETSPRLQTPSFSPGVRGFGPSGPDLGSSALGGRKSERSGTTARAPKNGADPDKGVDPVVLRQRLLDSLFQRLEKSADDAEAEGVAGAIQRVWFNSGSDTADLLMGRALVAERAKNYPIGRKILSKVVQIEPDWAEAWNELAIAQVLSKDPDGAMEDIAHALKIEPRHFGALTGMGALLLQANDKKGALRVFRRVLELYPRLAPVRSMISRLTIEVEGRDL